MIVIGISTLGLVLLVLLVIVVVLAGGGYMAMTRRTRAREAALQRELAQAEDALAQAHALDKGWDRATLEAAARAAAAERFGDGVVGHAAARAGHRPPRRRCRPGRLPRREHGRPRAPHHARPRRRRVGPGLNRRARVAYA